MKRDCPNIGIMQLCKLFGKTRHAYYDREWQTSEKVLEHSIVLELVTEQREIMPRIGTPKLYHLIKASLDRHGIKMGRDGLHALLSDYGMTVRLKKRRKVATTMSRHWMRKYSNLVREVRVDRPEQVWVSDITYIVLEEGFSYLSLVTDAYSRKIMGYALSPSLDHHGTLGALEDALSNRIYASRPLIHHSDRGCQYCCKEYVGLLKKNGIRISMTENGDPYENAQAERVNGILKDEFSLDGTFASHERASEAVHRCVKAYNENRPHASCDYLTPEVAHTKSGVLKKRWKTYPKKYGEGRGFVEG